MLYACDRKWWDTNEGAPDFQGLKVSLEDTAYDDVRRVNNTGTRGFDSTPGCVRTGKNSGYQAVHLAAGCGAKKIVLLGFDMQPTSGEKHWHGSHPSGLSDPVDSTFARWRGYFDGLATALRERGVEVLNATPTTALTCFPHVSLEDTL